MRPGVTAKVPQLLGPDARVFCLGARGRPATWLPSRRNRTAACSQGKKAATSRPLSSRHSAFPYYDLQGLPHARGSVPTFSSPLFDVPSWPFSSPGRPPEISRTTLVRAAAPLRHLPLPRGRSAAPTAPSSAPSRPRPSPPLTGPLIKGTSGRPEIPSTSLGSAGPGDWRQPRPRPRFPPMADRLRKSPGLPRRRSSNLPEASTLARDAEGRGGGARGKEAGFTRPVGATMRSKGDRGTSADRAPPFEFPAA
jgi:hypothetical protein